MADIKGRDIQVGDRVKLKIGLGTVRYVGGLDFQDGTWVGVQVDDESRTCLWLFRAEVRGFGCV